jgi:hypothetical protein
MTDRQTCALRTLETAAREAAYCSDDERTAAMRAGKAAAEQEVQS